MEETLLENQTINKVELPKQYKVILLNDDYTPMEFVVIILKEIFNKDDIDAQKLTMQIHLKGQGIVGIYYKDIAQTKCQIVKQLSEENNFPLQIKMEEI